MNTRSPAADASPKRPHVTDALAVKIGEEFRTLVSMEAAVQDPLGKIGDQWIKLGGMLIDVRLREKRHFSKWLKANKETLGFGRSKAFYLMKFARSPDGVVDAIAGPHYLIHYFPLGYCIGVTEHRRLAMIRSRKARAKLKDKIAKLEYFEQAQQAERKKRDGFDETLTNDKIRAFREGRPTPPAPTTTLTPWQRKNKSNNVVSIVDARGVAHSPLERAWNHASPQERAAFAARFHSERAALLAPAHEARS